MSVKFQCSALNRFFNKKHSLKIQYARRQTKKTPQILITAFVASKDVLYHTLPKVWQIPPVAPGIAKNHLPD